MSNAIDVYVNGTVGQVQVSSSQIRECLSLLKYYVKG